MTVRRDAAPAIDPDYSRDAAAAYQPMDRSEERDLIGMAQQGDAKAKDRVIQSWLRFAVQRAEMFWRPGHDLMDLVQEANLGLVVALEKYDLDAGARFSTYACYWIDQKIRRYLQKNASAFNIPAYVYGKVADVVSARREGRDVTSEDLGVSDQVFDAIVRNSSKWRVDTRHAHGRRDPQSEPEIDDADEIEVLLSPLAWRDRLVICCRVGLYGLPELTLDEIGRVLGLSRERVRQIHDRALERVARGVKNREWARK